MEITSVGETTTSPQAAFADGATRLREVAFHELFLGHPSLGDAVSDGGSREIGPWRCSQALRADVEQLKAACRAAEREAPDGAEYSVLHDGVPYRVRVIPTRRGPVTVVRRALRDLDRLDGLGLGPACIEALCAPGLSGLVLVAGGARSGRTTTACAVVRERLLRFGGLALTAETRCELPLEGRHGDGMCYQAPTRGGAGGLAEAFRKAVELAPQVALLGEIHDRDTAVLALAAGAAGRLVVSTLRADTPVKAVMRLHALANERVGADGARLLAQGLALVVAQRLHGEQARLQAAFLDVRAQPAARECLARSDYEALARHERPAGAASASAPKSAP